MPACEEPTKGFARAISLAPSFLSDLEQYGIALEAIMEFV